MYQQLFHKSKFLHRTSIVIRIDSIALLLKCNPFEQSRHGFIPIPFLRSQTSSWDTTTERKVEKKNQTISVINQISSTNRPFLFSWHIPPHKLAHTHAIKVRCRYLPCCLTLAIKFSIPVGCVSFADATLWFSNARRYKHSGSIRLSSLSLSFEFVSVPLHLRCL